MIKTIIFDLGGVYFTEGTRIAAKKISSKLGIPEGKVYDFMKKSKEAADHSIGKMTGAEFFTKAKTFWKIKFDDNEIAKEWHECYQPIEGTIKIIGKLRKAGFKLIFLSNNRKERVAYLEAKHNFLKNFEDGIFSHIAGKRKPDPEIYQMALEKAGCKAGECVYIDDKETNLAPAKKLGMHAILFESPEQLESDLRILRLEF